MSYAGKVDLQKLKEMYYANHLTHQEIGNLLGVHGSTICLMVRRLKWPIRKLIVRESNRLRMRKALLGQCGADARGWKGGITFKDNYRFRHAPNHPYTVNGKYVAEHRLVIERHLRRYLKPEEKVHHINGDRSDNRIENLIVLTQSAHVRLHNLERYNTNPSIPNTKCFQCHKSLYRNKSSLRKRNFCSHRCKGKTMILAVNKKRWGFRQRKH